MKRKFLVLLAIVACLCISLFAVGCWGNKPDGSTPPSDGYEQVGPYTQGLEYELTEEGDAYKVVGMGWATDTDIVIPNKIYGKQVVEIDNIAFEDCDTLTSVKIGNNVKVIGGYAFEDCDGLIAVQIPDSVTEIKRSAFYHCYNLTSLTIPDSVTYIGENAFTNCSSLTKVNYTGTIDRWAMSGIGRDFNCAYKLYINDVEVTEVNLTTATEISAYAFYKCSSLTSITIPDSVTSIGDDAFYNCSSLTSITIPNSVTSIGDEAFYRCSRLTSINFQGTQAEWNAITKGYCWDHHIGNYTVTCADGTIAKS